MQRWGDRLFRLRARHTGDRRAIAICAWASERQTDAAGCCDSKEARRRIQAIAGCTGREGIAHGGSAVRRAGLRDGMGERAPFIQGVMCSVWLMVSAPNCPLQFWSR